jgi:hypothetical protein
MEMESSRQKTCRPQDLPPRGRRARPRNNGAHTKRNLPRTSPHQAHTSSPAHPFTLPHTLHMAKKRTSAKKQRGMRGSSSRGSYDTSGRNKGMGIEVESQTSIPHPKGSGLKAVGSAGYVPESMAQAPAGLSRASFPVGTKVVRGPAWCGGRRMYGDQDGGAGNIGTVIELPPQLATKPEHSTRQWVAVRWLRTDVVATYRAGGTGHAGIFDVVPWEDHAPPGTDASRMVDLCDAYQRRQISRDEFKAALGSAGCPPGLEDNVIAMVEQKGMCAPAPAPAPAAADSPNSKLLRGTSVMLSGLLNAREFNGSTGVVRRYDAAAGRYEIELVTTGKIIRAKAACVDAIESPQDIGRDELLKRTGCRVPGVGKTAGCTSGSG